MADSRGADIPEICTIVAAPALAMVLGSVAVSMGEPSERLQARLQHLSAGLLVGAIVTEIFPILKERLFVQVDDSRGHAVSWSNLVAAGVGFGAALLLMYSIKALDLGSEEEQGIEESHAQQQQGGPAEALLSGANAGREERAKLRVSFARLQAHSRALSRLVESDEVDREALDEEIHGIDFLVDSARRLCRGAEPLDQHGVSHLRHTVGELVADIEKLRQMDATHVGDLDQQLVAAGKTLRQVHSHAERSAFRRWRPRPLRSDESPGAISSRVPSVPWGLIVAVAVDSVNDGMLIGLAGTVAATSGWLMALATAIEMGFLGYSFACALVKSVRCCTAALIAGLPPIAMLAAAAGAAAGATRVEHMPAFCGLVAFALVAVLFLVLQELLVEAHEKEENQAWHISVWLYIGLLLSIAFDVVL